MKKEKLQSEHIPVLDQYGLGGVDPSYISLCRYDSGEYILKQGYACPDVLLMLEGKMKVFITAPNGRTLLICYYTSAAILGEVELALDTGAAASSVQAITAVSGICIPRERYQSEMKNSIRFMNAVGAELAQKLFRSNKNSAATILHSLEARLCAYIANTQHKGYFKENLTEVAEILGTSYRHLLRTLENLCRTDVLEKTPRGYRIRDMAELARRGEGND